MRHRRRQPFAGMAGGAVLAAGFVIVLFTMWLLADVIVTLGLVREFTAAAVGAGLFVGYVKERWGNV